MSTAVRPILVLTAMLAASSAGLAQAQGLGTSNAYLKVFGGATLPKDDNFTLDITSGADASSGLDYDSGYMFGIAGGYLVTPDVALEIEYSFRASDATLDYAGGIDGQMKASTYMANAIYTFTPVDEAGAVRPYVGVGLGASDLTYEPERSGRLGGDLSFAWQAIAGVGYRMNESWTLSGELRYLGVSEEDVSADFASFEANYQTFDALVGASYRF